MKGQNTLLYSTDGGSTTTLLVTRWHGSPATLTGLCLLVINALCYTII